MSATRIRDLNDAFRRTFAGGKVLVTPGVSALPEMVVAASMLAVATFEAFDDDDDSYGEHDFGSFELCQRQFFWKIDYYDLASEAGSPDPADPLVTTRVLTVMLADEY